MDSTSHHDLAWVLDELSAVPGIVHAVVLSADGLVIQKSTVLPQDQGELLAAAASSLYSIAAGAGRRFSSGAVHQVVIEYHSHVLFIASAGENARLAVLCAESVDMGTVAYEMSRLVTRIGHHLSAEARAAASAGTGHPGT